MNQQLSADVMPDDAEFIIVNRCLRTGRRISLEAATLDVTLPNGVHDRFDGRTMYDCVAKLWKKHGRLIVKSPDLACFDPRQESPDFSLTKRERDVLDKLVSGLTNKEIAISLGISYETVKEHVAHILQKLDVRDRTQAAVLAVRKNIA